MASSHSDNEKLELVFLKLGLAESDNALQTIVTKFLPPVLLIVGSSDNAVRAKVLELLAHLNKRLKSRESVQLPVDALLRQLNDSSVGSFVKNFTISYIRTGFPRLSTEECIQLLPTIFTSLQGKPSMQQDILLRIYVENLRLVTSDHSPEQLKILFDFSSHSEATNLVIDYCFDFLFLPYSFSNKTEPPSGLSEAAMKRLTSGDSNLTPQIIEQVKISILKLIKSDLLPVDDVVCHLVVASADTKHTVTTMADLELRRHISDVKWNNVDSKLYRVYLGDAAMATKKTRDEATKRQPADIRMKLKLVTFLTRSDTAALRFPHTIQLIYDGLFGKTNSKLQLLTVQFVHSVVDKCSNQVIMKKQSTLILEALLKVTIDSNVAGTCRGLAYIGVAKLCRKVSDIFQQRIFLVQSMVDALAKEDDPQLKSSIREALIAFSYILRDIPSSHATVQLIVESSIISSDEQLQMVGIHYASTVFSNDDIPSRYQLLLAIGQGSEIVSTHARKALCGAGSRDDGSASNTTLPSFVSMVEYVHQKATDRLSTGRVHSLGGRIVPFVPSTFLAMVKYLRRCMAGDADDDSDAIVADKIRTMVVENEPKTVEVMKKYINLCVQLSAEVSDPIVMSYILEGIASCPESITAEQLLLPPSGGTSDIVASRLKWLKDQISHTNDKIRVSAAELYAIALRRNVGSPQRYHQLVPNVLHDANSQRYEVKHGSLLLSGHLVGDWLNIDEGEEGQVSRRHCTAKIISLLVEAAAEKRDVTMCGVACSSIGEIGRKAVLPILDGTNEESPSSEGGTVKERSSEVTKRDVVDVLLSLLSSQTLHKIREMAVQALGRLPVGDEHFPHTELILTRLLQTSEIKDVELNFSAGAALCSCALGTRSPERYSRWQEKPGCDPVITDGDMMQWLIGKVLSDYVGHRIPAVRQASCIWLMVMLKTDACVRHPHLLDRLMDLQNAFQSLLAESDDLTQDIASKGFGLVYDLAGPDLKKLLVDQLVESLTGSSSAPTSKVRIIGQDGSGLFHGGSVQLGKAPDGTNLSTYKELCSLASELNQPDLVYKFLHLANHHLYWNTKKGVAFGVRSIATAARDQLRPHLPRIVPRLYRYTFDPQPSVRSAMTSIWNVLADDSSKLVGEYLELIVDDLLRNVTDKAWRTRQASCHALTKLLQGGATQGSSSNNPLVARLADVWHNLLRVRDDIKETVRDAAQDTCTQLKKVTIRICNEINGGSLPSDSLAKILAVLLNDGLNSSVAEVKSLSLSTLVEISKVSGGMIKPCLAQMIGKLLEALSATEAPLLNYVHTRSSDDTQEVLDSVRVQSVKSNPLMETTARCLEQCDETTTKEVVAVLVDVAKRGVGLLTKAGSCHAIQTMVSVCGKDLTPFCGKLISALTTGVQDRSSAVRRIYSQTIGAVASVASDNSVEKTLLKMKQWYIEKDDEHMKHAAASVIHSIAQHSPDVLNRHATVVLPLAFYGTHEQKHRDERNKETDVSTMWKEIWEEFTPGLETALRLYMGEITQLCSACLQSTKWLTKSQAAAALSHMVKKQHSPTVIDSHLSSILQVLLEGLRGRTWEGKHHLIEALRDVTVHCNLNEEQVKAVLATMENESQRGKPSYRTIAVSSLASVLEAQKVDAFDRFWTIASPMLSRDNSSENSSDDDNDSSTNRKDSWQMKETYLKSVSRAWSAAAASTHGDHFNKVFIVLGDYASLSTHAMQVTSLQCIATMLPHVVDLHACHATMRSVVCDVIMPPLCNALGNIKFSTIREEALTAVQPLVDFMLCKDCQLDNQNFQPLIEALTSSPLCTSSSPQYDSVMALLKRITESPPVTSMITDDT